jgi:hypothetical protein
MGIREDAKELEALAEKTSDVKKRRGLILRAQVLRDLIEEVDNAPVREGRKVKRNR